jgi:nitroreductase
MMLAAHAIGLGTVWHNFPAKLSHRPEAQAYLREIGVPEGHLIYGTLAVGYPAGPLPPAPPRKPDVIIKR